MTYNILAVDDNDDILNLIEGLLIDEDQFNVIKANSGKKALDIIAKEHIDVVILDLMMPEMDGMDVLSIIRENQKTKDLKVIILTAKDSIADFSKSLEIGVSLYLNKPFSYEKLKYSLEAVLEQKLD